jgi:hypothetical protein
MEENEIFLSATRSSKDFAGVFEFDGETSYFYLYALGGAAGNRIVGAINISRTFNRKDEPQIEVRWNKSESLVGLFYKTSLLASYNANSSNRVDGYFLGSTSPTQSEWET